MFHRFFGRAHRCAARAISGLAVASSLLLPTAARADTSFVSVTGSFDPTATASSTFDVGFTVGGASNMTFRTWAWNGGINAAGQLIASGGIDSKLTLYYNPPVTQVASNDDINSGTNRDSLITFTVNNPTGFVRLQPFSATSLGDRHFALDIVSNSGSVAFDGFSGGGSQADRIWLQGQGSAVASWTLAGAYSLTGRLDVHSNGTFTVNAGANFSAPTVTINGLEDGGASLFQNGGSQSISTFFNVFSNGLVQQNGGSVNAGTLLLSSSAGALAQYRLAGSATLQAGAEILSGNSILAQSGGTHTVSNELFIGSSTPGADRAQFNLTGGTLSAGAVFILPPGELTLGTVTVSGGRISSHGIISVDTTKTATVNNPITLFGDSKTTLFASASLLPRAGILMFGGDVGGGGTIVLPSGTPGISGYGTIASGITNNGTTIRAVSGNLVLNPLTFTNLAGSSLVADPASNLFINATSSVANGGSITVNAGGAVVVTSTNLTNQSGASIVLKGGTIAAATTLTNSSGGTISGSGNISANLTNNGSMTFNGPTNIFGSLNNTAVINVRNDQTLVTGVTTNSGTINSTSGGKIVFDGGVAPAPVPGPPLPGGGLDGTGTLTVNAASLVIASYVRQSAATLAGTVPAPATLVIRSRADGGDTSVVNALNLSGGFRLDLADNHLIVNYTGGSPLAAIRAAVVAGYNPAGPTHWQGNGLTSSAAAANAGRAVGYAQASDVLGAAGGTFGGQTANAASVLVRYTPAGDATLDGIVDFNDLVKLAQNYNTVVSAVSDGWWSRGDFTYDGMVDFNDLVKLAQNYNTALPADSVPGASADFRQDLAAALAQVPEPSAALVLPAAAIAAHLRRRRARRPSFPRAGRLR